MIVFLLLFVCFATVVEVIRDCKSELDDVKEMFVNCLSDDENSRYSIFSLYQIVGQNEVSNAFASLNVKDNCSRDYDKINCLKDALENIVGCLTNFQINQLNNKISGLKAKTDFECENDGENELVLRDIPKWTSNIIKSLQKCDIKFKINEKDFIPHFEFQIPLEDAQLWTKNDCRKKFKWMKCVFRAYSKCEDETVAITLQNYYNSIYNSYSLCGSTISDIHSSTLIAIRSSGDLVPRKGGFQKIDEKSNEGFTETETHLNTERQCNCPTAEPCAATSFKISIGIFDYLKYCIILYHLIV